MLRASTFASFGMDEGHPIAVDARGGSDGGAAPAPCGRWRRFASTVARPLCSPSTYAYAPTSTIGKAAVGTFAPSEPAIPLASPSPRRTRVRAAASGRTRIPAPAPSLVRGGLTTTTAALSVGIDHEHPPDRCRPWLAVPLKFGVVRRPRARVVELLLPHSALHLRAAGVGFSLAERCHCALDPRPRREANRPASDGRGDPIRAVHSTAAAVPSRRRSARRGGRVPQLASALSVRRLLQRAQVAAGGGSVLAEKIYGREVIRPSERRCLTQHGGSWCRRERRVQFGLLVFLTPTTMALRIGPRTPRQERRTDDHGGPDPSSAGDSPSETFINGGCGFDVQPAHDELVALGVKRVAKRMEKPMTQAQARRFVTTLLRAAGRLHQRYAKADEKPKGAGWELRWDQRQRQWVYGRYSTFDEALATIRRTAAWYSAIADGSGVSVDRRIFIWLREDEQ